MHAVLGIQPGPALARQAQSLSECSLGRSFSTVLRESSLLLFPGALMVSQICLAFVLFFWFCFLGLTWQCSVLENPAVFRRDGMNPTARTPAPHCGARASAPRVPLKGLCCSRAHL